MGALAAAIPALIGGIGSIVGNAMAPGAPGQGTGAMDPSQFGYGGGVKTDAQRQAEAAAAQATSVHNGNLAKLEEAKKIANANIQDIVNGKVTREQVAAAKAAIPGLEGAVADSGAKVQDANAAAANATRLIDIDQKRFQDLADVARGRESVTKDMKSGAAFLMGQGLDQANAQAMSQAASARGGGGNAALAQRAAMMAGAQNAQQAAQNAGILTAQESAQKAALELQNRDQAYREAMGYETARANALNANQQGSQTFQTTESQRKTGLATGAAAANTRKFENIASAGQSTATGVGTALAAGEKKPEPEKEPAAVDKPVKVVSTSQAMY